MRSHIVIASVALLACTDSSSRDLDTDDGSAATVQDASVEAGALGTTGPSDATLGAANPSGDPRAAWHAALCDGPPSAPLPASPTKFSVQLGRTECFGVCAVFSLAVDQDGHVTFYGDNYVARYGLQQKQVPPADARAIYDALYMAGYSKLNRCYIDASDGCRESTDAPSSKWNVYADGVAKAVERYHGCEHPSPELAQVDAAASVLLDKAGVNAWVGPRPKPQPAALAALKATSYRLSNAGRSLGTLTIRTGPGPVPPPDAGIVFLRNAWELADCENMPRATGTVSAHVPFYVLVAGQSSYEMNPPRFVRQQLPITLPSLGDVGSILIQVTASGDVSSAHAQRGDEDIPLELLADQLGC